MKELVMMHKNDIYTTSLIISENINIDHKSVVKLIKDYSTIDELKRLTVAKVSTKGRAINNYLLTEEQALILVSLMNNTPEVIKFKVGLVKAFIKYRKLSAHFLSQKNNAEWIIKRQETKTMRKECTDIIQRFVEYAKEQGSKSADKYYMIYSRMELTGLFLIEEKYPNARDVMSMRQLNLIEMADEAITNVIKEEMDKKTPYKEIYQRAKEKIELLAKIFPPSPLPMLLEKDKSIE